jgi:Mg-chelatase subunit ChlD
MKPQTEGPRLAEVLLKDMAMRTNRRSRVVWGVLAASCAVVLACGSSATGIVAGGDAGGDGSGHGGQGDGSVGKGDGHVRDTGGGHGGGNETGVLIGSDANANGGDAACGSVKKQAQKVPVDLVFGIDTSFSMDFENKWTSLSGALETFVTDPASNGLNLGIQFFPLRETCVVSAYEDLAVPLGPQATVAPLIASAIEGKRMAGGTPTVQILEGLVAYVQANETAGIKPIIVLATDGVPDSTCLTAPDGGTPNSLANAEAVAAAAFAATPSIPTFVIGVGSDLTALNALAAAGGTTTATLVDVGADGGNAEQAFVDALNAIRQQAVPCQFTLPSGAINPSLTNVVYTPGTGPDQTFVYVGTAADCSMASADGWYFDNPTQPTQVILCNGACNVVKADPAAQVDVELGCPRTGLK